MLAVNLRLIAFGLVCIPLPVSAAAQEGPAGSDGDGEIVVTAQRRSESVKDVPIAISAFTGPEIQRRGIVDSVDIARETPGAFVSSSSGGQFSQFSIRGVTQNDINDFVEGPVAVYVDDTYIPSPQGQSFGLFDLDRVEVLKGPQGTLFGRNATGGLVHFIVAKPTSTLQGYTNFSYGSHDQTKLEAALSGPLSDTLQGRVSVYWNRFDPWMKNIYPGNVTPNGFGTQPIPDCCDDAGNEDALAGRLQLQFRPDDRLTVRATASASRQILSTAPYNQIATVPVVTATGSVVGGIYASPTETRAAVGPDGSNYTGLRNSPATRTPGADWFGYLAPDGSEYAFGSDYSKDDAESIHSYDAALHVDYDLDGATLASITNWKKLTKHFGVDGEVSPLNFVNVWSDADTMSVSQELRLSGRAAKLDWTAGAYYLHSKVDTVKGYVAPARSVFAARVGYSPTGISLAAVNQLKATSYSLFGQIDYHLTSKFTVVLGGRVIRERQSFWTIGAGYALDDNYSINTDNYLYTALPLYENKRSDTLWAGKALLEYRPDADTLVYAGINRGVKGGNYNSQIPSGGPALAFDKVPYAPETLTDYEIGFKRSVPSVRGFVSAAAYYYDYKDYQAFLFSNAVGYTQNRDARTYGGEVEASMEPIDGLRLRANFSLVDPKVKDLQIVEGVVRDVEPTFTPHRQAGGEISYRVGLGGTRGSLTFSFNGQYISSFYTNIRNFESQKLPGYSVFNGSLVWEPSNGLAVTALVTNLFDKHYAITSFDLTTLCGCSEIAYGKPRWWRLGLSYKF